MASSRRRLATNVEGDFYVDETCIDCGACRWIAPETFDAEAGQARVHAQPADAWAERRALQALVACPTASIGAEGEHDVRRAQRDFPQVIDDGVYYCGFHSERSFGAASYLIVRSGGNVLIDSPRFNRGLADRIEALGGARFMFLTHRDDVADHEKWHARLGAERIIHAADQSRSTAGVERTIQGEDAVALAGDLVVIPTPGHTRGSACLLFAERVLFSGDHVAYDRRRGAIHAFRGACWYDWTVQIRSMERLLEHRFERILPGHGAPCAFPAEQMHREMGACVEWMRRR